MAEASDQANKEQGAGFVSPQIHAQDELTAQHIPPEITLTPKQESKLVAYLDDALLEMNRRFNKRLVHGGYSTFDLAEDDFKRVAGLLRQLGASKRYLIISYTLQLADLANDAIAAALPVQSSFDPYFNVLRELDALFTSSLSARPGRPSVTDEVRIRGVAEQGRRLCAEKAPPGTELNVLHVYESTLEALDA